jgi:hypothetical protein
MEVEMNPGSPTRIELSAAQALVHWKNEFANLVKSSASKIATANGSDEVTLENYQQAAEQAIADLGNLIKSETNSNERRIAA